MEGVVGENQKVQLMEDEILSIDGRES